MKLNELQLSQALEDLKKLGGLPPYDGGSNIVRGDGYYAVSLERTYGMPIDELKQVTGYTEIQSQWQRQREAFIEGQKS